jgi:hypothetical protein
MAIRNDRGGYSLVPDDERGIQGIIAAMTIDFLDVVVLASRNRRHVHVTDYRPLTRPDAALTQITLASCITHLVTARALIMIRVLKSCEKESRGAPEGAMLHFDCQVAMGD